MRNKPTRRTFLQASTASVAACLGTGLRSQESFSSTFKALNDQPVVGFIGTGIRFHTYHCKQALKYGPCAAIADCDLVQAGRAQQAAIDIHRADDLPLVIDVREDYRHVLDRSDVDVIVIGSVDHWHTKMVVDALNAGKDVYCEKPLTLTIREGQQIVEAQKKTGRIIQVGTQQRTEFDCATKFNVKCTFADGVEMFVRDAAPDLGFENGIMFEGSAGRFLVNRGKIVGRPVELLKETPLPDDAYSKLYDEPSTPFLDGYGKDGFHMKNFMECIKTRNTPASDVQSHNRMLNVCHAINIALRLGRALIFDPKTETFDNDQQANSFIEREQRMGYETVV